MSCATPDRSIERRSCAACVFVAMLALDGEGADSSEEPGAMLPSMVIADIEADLFSSARTLRR